MSGRPDGRRATPSRPRRTTAAALAGLLAAGTLLAGCGETDPTGAQTRSDTLTLWAALPLRGPWGAQGRAISDGAQLQLARTRAQAGPFRLRLAVADTSEGGPPTAAGAADAVGTAVRDRIAIGLIAGPDPESVRTAVPLGQQVGLTSMVTTGADLGDPEALTPTRRRSWMQLGSDDAALADAMADRLRAAGCARPVVLGGRGAEALGDRVADAAPGARGVTIRGADLAASRTARSVRSAVRAGGDCLAVAGEASSGDPARLLAGLRGADLRAVVLSRGATTETAARAAGRGGLPVAAIVEGPGDDDPAVAALAATYRRVHGRPMPPGVVAGARAVETVRRAVVRAGAGGNRRDRVPIALAETVVPGPPRDARPARGLAVPGTGLARARPRGGAWVLGRSVGAR